MTVRILHGDCREVLCTLPDESVHCVVTSPPYFGLRDYGVAGQVGLEPTPQAYVDELVGVFREVRRVLRSDGTVWLNLGDSYAGGGTVGAPRIGIVPGEGGKLQGRNRNGIGAVANLKPKDLIGIPWLVAFALRADGWWLRSDIIWSKSNPMPESVTDRPTSAHEHVFLLAKSERYFYDGDAVREPYAIASLARYESDFDPSVPSAIAGAAKHGAMRDGGKIDPNPLGRNMRNVLTIPSQPFPESHFATFPPALIEPCIKAGCPKGGTVLDPFGGAGTTGMVADRLGRNAILIELNETYAAMAERRLHKDAGLFADVEIEPAA